MKQGRTTFAYGLLVPAMRSELHWSLTGSGRPGQWQSGSRPRLRPRRRDRGEQLTSLAALNDWSFRACRQALGLAGMGASA